MKSDPNLIHLQIGDQYNHEKVIVINIIKKTRSIVRNKKHKMSGYCHLGLP